jgi:hypothetical protein
MHEYIKKALTVAVLVVSAAFASCLPKAADFPDRTSELARATASPLTQQGYLSDRDGRWHPYLMFFVPLTEPASWGAGLPGSPVVGAFTDTPERHTVFLIPVAKWSDGTPDEH